MKVRFLNNPVDFNGPVSGKNKFMSRLMAATKQLGIEWIVNDKDKCDIDFHISTFKHKTENSRKRIVRFDNVHVDRNENWKRLNERLYEARKRADGIIYQSNFAKRMCDAFIGKAKCEYTIINNGADPEYYKNIEPQKSEYKYNFLASTRRWVNWKRLGDVVEGFKLANIDGSALFVAGDTLGKKYSGKNIFFLGGLNDSDLAPYYKLCNAMIHMSWIDACPNSVVEAMCAGCPIIAANHGGTPELGQMALVDDVAWDYREKNLDKLPHVDIKMLAQKIIEHKERPAPVSIENLHIDVVAKKYVDFFEKIIK